MFVILFTLNEHLLVYNIKKKRRNKLIKKNQNRILFGEKSIYNLPIMELIFLVYYYFIFEHYDG